MVQVDPPRPLVETDDRSTFECGRDSMNLWFRRHAWTNHASGASRVTVLCGQPTALIVGYVTLSAGQIERAYLPKPQQRNRPDPLPVTLLGQLAIHTNYQRRGYASSLVYFALKTAFQASRMIGSVGVITHPLDEGLRDFYRAHGFQDLPFDPKRAMIIRMIDIEMSDLH